MQLANGKLRVNASFGLKVGLPNYSSKDRQASVSLEYDLPTDVDLEVAVDEALKLQARLDTELKFVVGESLSVEIGDDGQPILPDAPKAEAKSKATSKRSSGGGARKSYGASKGSYDDPTLEVETSEGTFQVRDQRELIRKGKFSEKSPAFKLIDGEIDGSDGVWKYSKGSRDINPIYQELVEAFEDAS